MPGSAPVKLRCEALWRVYGAEPAKALDEARRRSRKDDAREIARRIKDADHIAAACDVTFEVPVGETFVIMGLSGSGKSTVLRCLSRLIEATAGTLEVEGRSLPALSDRELVELRRHKFGMVFQHFGLMPHQTVLENVEFPLRIQRAPRGESRQRALDTLEMVGLSGREDSYPWELSGGQQQRVGFARSLVTDPEVWLLDEPFSALDPLIRRQMQDEFLRLQAMLNKAVVFVTHDFLEAVRIGDRIAIMRDGFVVQTGRAADLILRPADDYVREFTQDVPRMKVLTALDLCEPRDEASGPVNRTVSSAASLEDIAAQLAEDFEPISVVDQDGAVVGTLRPEPLRRALKTGQ
jgi:glycine betaine/proline transport system ATP-binding protein